MMNCLRRMLWLGAVLLALASCKSQYDALLSSNDVETKYKAASFYIAKENKVVYFFCKTEAGLQRRLQNLLFDRQMKNSHWPYADKATAEHLRYPKA